jgi:hypothetical protein
MHPIQLMLLGYMVVIIGIGTYQWLLDRRPKPHLMIISNARMFQHGTLRLSYN